MYKLNWTRKQILSIGDIGCSGCANTVQEALNNIDGVANATVNLENESASIMYKANVVSIDDFRRAVEEAGYEFRGEK